MSIENESLRLLPHTLRTDSFGQWVIERSSDGAEIEVPSHFRSFFKMAHEGSSISAMAATLRHLDQPRRFASLARFLCFLYDSHLLADKRAVRLAEALRPDHVWKSSLAFDPLMTMELVRISGGPAPKTLARLIAIGMTVAALWVFVRAFLSLSTLVSQETPWAESVMATAPLIAFLFAFSVGRSLKGVAQWLITRFVAGSTARLSITVDPVSVAFSNVDFWKNPGVGGAAFLIAGLATSVAGLGSIVLASWLGLPDKVLAFVPAFAWFLFLLEVSPFSRSEWTEWMRSLYGAFDRSFDQDGRRQFDLERGIKRLHVGSSLLWIFALGAFFVFCLGPLLLHLSRSLLLSSLSAKIFAGLLGLFVLIAILSLAEDLLSSTLYGSGDDERRVRRLFRRRSAPFAVGTAVQEGLAPARSELEKLPLIRQLDSETRNQLLERAEIRDLAEGQPACRQGSNDRSLFVLLSGRMAVAKRFDSLSSLDPSRGRRKVVAFLEAGSVFGEAAFFFGQQRTADVVAMEPSRLLVIKHDASMKTVDANRSEELQLRIWFMQSLVSGTVFRDLPSEALDSLVVAGRKRTFKAGEKVISEGEIGKDCYFLIQGRASVTQNTRLINKVKAGDAFGEIALLRPGILRTATIVADTDLLTVVVDSERFWGLLASHLPLAVEFERLAEARLASDQRR